MKRLESIGLVQFFLYEREDLEVGTNTAFLGPNGTGKTAFLDALQTVFLAADGNRMHFNASGEGKKRARSLRDYCLGIYGQTAAERCRDSANTYIDLVFRDPRTNTPVTAGISLSVAADQPETHLNSLYILPGVAMTTRMHVEREAGRDVVQPWRAFQHVAADACRMHGATPFFTTNREEFTRRLLLEHLALPGDRPNVHALRLAFARSLKLNQDVSDLNETLRHHLIEARPTNIREFRARLDQFRDVRDLIRRLKERVGRAGEVIDRYAIVHRERTSEANLAALKATYTTDRLGETVGEAEVQIESLQERLEANGQALDRAKREVERTDRARVAAIASLSRSPEFQRQAADVDRLGDLRTELKARSGALGRALEALEAAARASSDVPELEGPEGEVAQAITCLAGLRTAHANAELPQTELLAGATRSTATLADAVRRALSEAEGDLKDARHRKREADMALERASRGLPAVRDDTLRLQRVLRDAGIDAVPVCDLVTVTDSRWQAALEGYLSRHVEALLLPEEKEIEALSVYQTSKGGRDIYGVKLALRSRVREWRKPGTGRFAAELLTGSDIDAVRYLQSELGRVQLADNDEALRRSNKAFTATGMISSGGGVDRRRLPAADQLLLGRRDDAAARQRAADRVHESAQAVAQIGQRVERLTTVDRLLGAFADPVRHQAALEDLFQNLVGAQGSVGRLQRALEAAQTDGLAVLQQARADADIAASQAQENQRQLEREAVQLAERTANVQSQLDVLQRQHELAAAQEQAARLAPLYNANEVERHRARIEARVGEDWEKRVEACAGALQRARSTAENADREAWSLFTQYVADYQLKNQDIGSSQWMRAFDFVLADRQRLVELELTEQEAKAEGAYDAAVRVFRTDVAQALLTGFDRIDEQIRALNRVLEQAPAFSNNERYQFRAKPVEEHRALHTFLMRVREAGGLEEDIFGGSGELPAEFRALVEEQANSELLSDSSPLNDHRRFYSYDVEIYRDGKPIGWLSRRLGPGSGGEHRTPLYVIFGAALAAAYGKAASNEGGGVMLLDEAFEKMDPQNVRATVEYLNALGLQLVMAGPETDQAKMSSFLDIYYDMARFGSRTIQLTKNVVLEPARELLMSDNFLRHPELMEQALAAVQGVGETSDVAG